MIKPRTTLLALSAVLAGAALSGLGVAQADTSTTASNTIVVNGSDTITIDPNSSNATQQSTYQTALGDAITNAHQKATFIAGQIGVTLGAVTNVTEQSDSSNICSSPILYAQGTAKPPTATTTPAVKKHKHKKGPMRIAIINPSSQCSVQASVTVTYGITP